MVAVSWPNRYMHARLPGRRIGNRSHVQKAKRKERPVFWGSTGTLESAIDGCGGAREKAVVYGSNGILNNLPRNLKILCPFFSLGFLSSLYTVLIFISFKSSGACIYSTTTTHLLRTRILDARDVIYEPNVISIQFP